MKKLFRVAIEHYGNPEDGMVLLDTFTVKAANEDVALEAAYDMAWEQYPDIGVLECGGIERVRA
ncbi:MULTISPECIES: hypothetical protein [Paenarthrobacter]|uniref:Uncharacterized protein n=1 Tax=Paenarthrobacter ureafaciens TaxID=37931 RepID=A0AAX3EFW1_PAEUR|nr:MULTISPECIES: hypothetical protein [Paenarthrobacter]MDO5866004.1 hypothetical protein [Paenarthrobacter sp. SD-2]MDO5877099.1 hypothetical protein [Paenarthrobacter sp. SD-1]UYV92301.1 hypothetical protein NL395_17530 [Paenarthrobacter ureafaciens]UYV96836.1 hypothetical protein NL394_17560 [Paenarthrobacter ureafaciens]WIV32201.1 hypothetical protein QN084_06210 [Paenarthrobacter sp. R1]